MGRLEDQNQPLAVSLQVETKEGYFEFSAVKIKIICLAGWKSKIFVLEQDELLWLNTVLNNTPHLRHVHFQTDQTSKKKGG